jgi:hypothetical protein
MKPGVIRHPSKIQTVKTLLSMLRMFHYLVGITAPDKKHEKAVLFLWIGLFLGLLAAGLLFTWFIVPRVIK